VNTVQKEIRPFFLIVDHPTTFQDLYEHKSGVYPTKLDVINTSDGARRDIDI
jgi:hypothetical protein